MDIAPPRGSVRVYAGNITTGSARVQYGDIYGDVTYNIYEARDQRIGIEASISGLRSLTNSIHAQLQRIQTVEHGLAAVIQDVLNEVAASQVNLDGLNYKLPWLHTSPEQAVLIKVDQLVILFANAIVLFDRFRTKLDQLYTDESGDTPSFGQFLTQLHEHNRAWRLQLDLMNRHTETETGIIASHLNNATDKLLRENTDLRRRMDEFQMRLDRMSKRLPGSRSSLLSRTAIDTQMNIVDTKLDTASSSSTSSFEDTLNSSWVYRRNRHRSEILTIDTSVLRYYAWSEISELTLANISALSVLALPIDLAELSHQDWYRDTHAQTPRLPSVQEEAEVKSLIKQGRESWVQLSDAQVAFVSGQLKKNEMYFPPVREQSPQLSLRRIRHVGRNLLGRRDVTARDIIRQRAKDGLESPRDDVSHLPGLRGSESRTGILNELEFTDFTERATSALESEFERQTLKETGTASPGSVSQRRSLDDHEPAVRDDGEPFASAEKTSGESRSWVGEAED